MTEESPNSTVRQVTAPEVLSAGTRRFVWVRRLFGFGPKPRTVVGLEEVVESLTANRPTDGVYRGAVLRALFRRGWQLRVLFVDESGTPAANGRIVTLYANELDPELVDLFDGKDLLILE